MITSSAPDRSRILVVDDEWIVVETFRMVLSARGHAVEAVCDPKRALALFEVGRHDVVITDWQMENLDGLELARKVKECSPGTRVILITAHAETIAAGGRNQTSIDAVLGKCCSVLELQSAVEKVLAGKGTASASPSP